MSSKPASVLVIGGCGFLGHHIVSQLRDKFPTAQISVLDLYTNRNRFSYVSYYDANITSKKDVKHVLQDVMPEVIIHTASPVATDYAGAFDLYHEVNVEGTRTLLECAGQIGCVKAFIYTSSASVIHDSVNDLVRADETWPVLLSPQQTLFYYHTKGLAENYVLAANRKYGDMLTLAIRPAGIFGEGDLHMLPRVLNLYYTRKTKVQFGNNKNWIDFTYVGNAAHAHILATEKLLQAHSLPPSKQERVDGEAFLVTNDEPFHFWDFVYAVWAVAGDKTDVKDIWVLPKSLYLIMATLAEWIFWIIFLGRKQPRFTREKAKFTCKTKTFSINKIKRRLGYKPLWSMDEGIKRGVKWCEEKRLKEGKS